MSGADSLVWPARHLQAQAALVGALDLVLLDADQSVQRQTPVLGHGGVEVLGEGNKITRRIKNGDGVIASPIGRNGGTSLRDGFY